MAHPIVKQNNLGKVKRFLSSWDSSLGERLRNKRVVFESMTSVKSQSIKVGQIWHMKKYTNSKQYHRTLKICVVGSWFVTVCTPDSMPYDIATETLLFNYRPAPQQRTKPTAKCKL